VIRDEVFGNWLVLTVNHVHQKLAFVFFEQFAELVRSGETSLNGRQEYAVKKEKYVQLYIANTKKVKSTYVYSASVDYALKKHNHTFGIIYSNNYKL